MIKAGPGDDTIDGGAGDDVICGELGNDRSSEARATIRSPATRETIGSTAARIPPEKTSTSRSSTTRLSRSTPACSRTPQRAGARTRWPGSKASAGPTSRRHADGRRPDQHPGRSRRQRHAAGRRGFRRAGRRRGQRRDRRRPGRRPRVLRLLAKCDRGEPLHQTSHRLGKRHAAVGRGPPWVAEERRARRQRGQQLADGPLRPRPHSGRRRKRPDRRGRMPVGSGLPASDRMYGGPGRDRLSGGPKKDFADGGSGRDLCRAEKKKRCP